MLLLGGFIGCTKKLPINGWSIGIQLKMMDRPSNKKISLCWYKKGTNNKWTYDLIDHLIVNLETISALASMTYIVDLNAYEFHPGDENSSMTLLMNVRVLRYTYDRDLLLSKIVFYINVNDYIYERKHF